MADELLYWEDLQEEGALEIGSHTFTEEEIIAFARQFDPQPFHVDPEAAPQASAHDIATYGDVTAVVKELRLQELAFTPEILAAGETCGI